MLVDEEDDEDEKVDEDEDEDEDEDDGKRSHLCGAGFLLLFCGS